MEQVRASPVTAEDRLYSASRNFGRKTFARKVYLKFSKSISMATASRDLVVGVQSGQLKKIGEKALTKYYFAKAD